MLDWFTAIVAVLILGCVWKMSEQIELALARLQNEITDLESAVDSAVVLINGISAQLREALMGDGDLAERISGIADALDMQGTKLATAVAENTDAAEDSDEVYDPDPIGAGDASESAEESPSDEGGEDGEDEESQP